MRRISFVLVSVVAWISAVGRPGAETLSLPPDLIALDSPEGETLLFEAEAWRSYFPLSIHFVSQVNQAFCGVAAMVMVLNAFDVRGLATPQWKPYTAFDQENFFSPATEAILPRAVVEQRGMTLTKLGGLPGAFGLKAEVHHASDSSADDFRRVARATLDASDRYVIANYLRKAIGQESGGHISPLAAYDEDSDRFLILDVSRYKYPPVWVETEALFAAMHTPDSDNDNKSRGFIVVSR
jgi:hypothetical protein